MKLSLPRHVHRAMSVLLASAMLASNMLVQVPVARAGTDASAESTSGSPGVSAIASPTVIGEIEASRTADSSTFAMSDGSRRAEIYTEPVHYEDPSGRWEDIDPTLVPTGVFGQERARATALAETFGSDEGTGPPVTVSGGDWSLGMDLLGGEQGQPFALGDQALYPLAQTDTQLSYESRSDGVKDTLVLSSADAPDTFTFFVSLKDLAIYTEPGSGAYALYDSATGRPVGRMEPLSVFDSADRASVSATAAVCREASMTVASVAGGAYVTYHIPRAWMADPARVYPLYVDPTVTFAGASNTRNDLYVAKGDSAYHYGDNHLDASLFASPGDLRRAFVNFLLGSIPRGAFVDSAVLQMYLWQNTSGGDFTTICQPLLGTWGYNATWANTFGNNSVSIGTGGDYTQIPGGPDHYAKWDMTNVVQRWVSGTLPNNGLVLYANSESAACKHSFWSAEYTTYTSRQPHLIVDYTNPTLTADAIPDSVSEGQRVELHLHSNSAVVTNLEAKVDGAQPDKTLTTTAQFAFTTFSPGADWVSVPVSGGYLSYLKTPATMGAHPAVVPDLSSSWVDADSEGAEACFVYSIGDGHADIQNNRLSIIDSDWQSTWQDTGMSYQAQAQPVASTSVATTASALWFDENSGGNDPVAAGRGSVALSWPAASLASGYGIFLFDGNIYRQVGVTSGTTWSSSGKQLYPADSTIAGFAGGYTLNPFACGSADLRDDPRPLYAKTPGTVWDDVPAYAFKVVPFNSGTSVALSECETVTVALAGRTRHVCDDPAHTVVDLGKIGPDDGSVRLDRGDFVLHASDVALPGLGPDACVSRVYRSSSTTSPLSAAGWRFNFERSLVAGAGSVGYVDEVGDLHAFRNVAGMWVAPHGDTDRLRGDWTSGFVLSHKDRTSTSFDASGRMTSESDAFGNTVHYDWAPDGSSLAIRAPKDIPLLHERRITVALRDGKVVSVAAHPGGSDADRVVNYATGATSLTVTALPGTDSERTTVYRYDGAHRVQAVAVAGFSPSDHGEAVWSIAYDQSAPSISVTNDTGAGTPVAPRAVSWDALAGTGSAASASGTSTLTFDVLGRQTSATEENTTSATSCSFDVEGDTIARTSPSGHTSRAVFDGRGNQIAETDEAGATTTRQFDGDLCTLETDPKGAVTTRTFASATGALLTEERTLNDAGDKSHVEYAYNPDGGLQIERKTVSPGVIAQTAYSDYADCGHPQRATKASVEIAPGVTTDLASATLYDGFGSVTSVADPTGATTAVNAYDAAGRLTETTDASGTVSHWRYGVLGAETKRWRSSPSTTGTAGWIDTTPNAAGDPMTEVARASDATTVSIISHTYDSAGREVAADNSAVPGVAVTRYDAQSNVAQSWHEGADTANPAASLRTTFDADGREASSSVPGATSASTVTSYNAVGQVAACTQAEGATTADTYDQAGNLSLQTVNTDAGDAQTAITSDLDGRPTDEVDPDGTTCKTAFDLDGNAVASDLGNGTVSTTRVNCLGWPLLTTGSDGVVTLDSYDTAGRLIAETVGGLQTTRAYDSCGRPIRQVNPDGTVVTRAYDCFGDEIACNETSGTSVLRSILTRYDSARRIARETVSQLDGLDLLVRTHSYSADGRDTVTETRGGGDVVLTTVTDGAGAVRSQTGTMCWHPIGWSVNTTDAAGRTTSIVANGVPAMSSTWTQTGKPAGSRLGLSRADYLYSTVSGRKEHDSYHFVMGGRNEADDYTYDLSGRLTAAVQNGVKTTYGYDGASGALIGIRTGSAALVRLSYQAGGSGRLTAAGDRRYSCDALGRRTGTSMPGNPYESSYKWTGDRLTGFSAGRVSATYTYDGSGRRLRSTVTSAGVTTSTSYQYDGTRLLGLDALRSDGTEWTFDYVYDDAGALLGGTYCTRGKATWFASETNARGDVRELLDENGLVFAFYGYDAYGNPTEVTTAGTAGVPRSLAIDIATRQPLRYASYVYDAESSLYYCSARYYDSSVGAFISKDPGSSDDGESAFQYCSDDPVNHVDPTGCDVWGYGKYGDSYYRGLKGGELVLVSYCLSRVGGAYVFGAKAKPGKEWLKGPLDCSGLTAAAYRVAHAVDKKTFPTLPDGSANQHDASRSLGFNLKASRLKISDLGFLHDGGKDSGTVHHVGIYIGHGELVEARGKKWGVVKTSVAAFNKRGADWHRARKR